MPNTERLLADLTSWYWWVTVILVGLLVNLGSAYLKPVLDRVFNDRAVRRRKERAQRDLKFSDDVYELKASPSLMFAAGFNEQRYRSITMTSILVYFFFLAFGYWMQQQEIPIGVKVFIGVVLVTLCVAVNVMAVVASNIASGIADRLEEAKHQLREELREQRRPI